MNEYYDDCFGIVYKMIVIFTQIQYVNFICILIYIHCTVRVYVHFIGGGVHTCVHVSGGVGCPIF
jgi:hypothetical protein